MAIQSQYPNIKPTLNLNFAGTKTLDPRITFSRPSPQTYYDGKTFAKAEENLLLWTNDFNNAIWTGGNVSKTAVAAPDGSNTACRFGGISATSSLKSIIQTVSFSADGDKTVSIFAKAGTAQFLQILTGNNNQVFANFDLTAGTVGSVGPLNTAAIVAMTGGWYRCSITTAQTNPSNVQFAVVTSASALQAESNTLTTTIDIAWPQFEQRSQATAYTPTTDQPITRYVPQLMTAPANVPVFDHDPITGESLGYVGYEQRTNLLTWSEQFENTAWTKTRASVAANVTVAPDGTLTADKLVEDTSASTSHYFRRTLALAASTVYTTSIYAKAAERSELTFSFFGSAGWVAGSVRFDLLAGTSALVSGASPFHTIQAVGNGWYRCVVTATTDETAVNRIFDCQISVGGSTLYTGDGTSGIYIWGAQLEAGAFPTSYIKTEGSQVTRAASSMSMTGANFSSWYRQDQGTFVVDWTAGRDVEFISVVSLGSTVANGGFYNIRRGSTGGVGFNVLDGTKSQASLTVLADVPVPGTTYSAACAYGLNNFAASTNGGSVSTDTSGTVPSTIGTFVIGNGWNSVTATIAGSEYLNGHIRSIRYYPKRLTNAQLQALSRS